MAYEIELGVKLNTENVQSQIDAIQPKDKIKVELDTDNIKKQINSIKSEIEKLNNINVKIGGKGSLDNGLKVSSGSAVKDAQKVGKQIGDTISNSVKQSVNLDDVIDKQVSSLMSQYSIAGKKGSKAFNEIRDAIVNYRTELAKADNVDFDQDDFMSMFANSANIKNATSALASHIKIANEAKNEYKDLLEYIQMLNRSGAKIHLPDSIRQEYGDDFASMRNRLGKGFTTGSGGDFESWVSELNAGLGNIIDLSHGAEAAFGDLVNKIDIAKGKNFLSEKEMFDFGYLNMDEIENDITAAVNQISIAEQQMAQQAQQSANTVIQAEEKKQQAVKQTSQEMQRLQNNSKNVINVKDFADTGIDDTVNHIEDLKKSLRISGFNDDAIKEIIKDFENLKVEVKDLQTTLQGNTLKIDVKGLDQHGRLVNTSGSFAPDADGNLTSGGFRTSVKQTFKLASEEAQQFSKDLLSIGGKMGTLQEKISRLEFKGGSSKQISALKKELKELETEYSNVEKKMNDAGVKLSAEQDDAIKAQFKNTENNLKEIEATYKDTQANLAKGIKFKFDTGEFDKDISNITTKTKELGKIPDSLKNEIAQLKRAKTEMDKALASGDVDKAIRAYDRYEQRLKTINNQLKIGSNDNAVSNSAYSKLDKLQSKIERIKTSISKLDPKVNTKELEDFQRELTETETDYKNLYNELKKELTPNQKNALSKRQTNFDNRLNSKAVDETNLEIEKQRIKEVNSAFSELEKTQRRIGQLKFKLTGLDSEKDAGQIQAIQRELINLEAKAKGLRDAFGSSFDSSQMKKLADMTRDIDARISQLKAHMADNSAVERQTQAFNKLLNIKKQIDSTKIRIEDLKLKGGHENEIADYERVLAELRASFKETASTLEKPLNANQWGILRSEATQTQEKITALKSSFADLNAVKANKIKNNFAGYDAQLQTSIVNAEQLSKEYGEITTSINNVRTALSEMKSASNDADLIEAEKRYQNALKETNNLIKKNKAEENRNLRSDSFALDKQKALQRLYGLFEKDSAAAKRFGNEIKKIEENINACGNSAGIKNVNKQIDILGTQLKNSNLQTKTFGTRLKEQWSKYSAYFGVATVFMRVTQGIRDMFQQVVKIDTAMTELKKVTDETDASYNQFLTNAADRATRIGTTIDGLVSSTADFARLGYNFTDSQGLAEVANIYSVVGDEIEGVEGATKSLISTMAAFKSEASGVSNTDFAMDIVDKFNEVS